MAKILNECWKLCFTNIKLSIIVLIYLEINENPKHILWMLLLSNSYYYNQITNLLNNYKTDISKYLISRHNLKLELQCKEALAAC